MGKCYLRTSDISQVRHYTKGHTDYLEVKKTDGDILLLSVYHRDYTRAQMTACEKLAELYAGIKDSMLKRTPFIELIITNGMICEQ